MDVSTYYITTLTTAVTKIGPVVAFIVVGYFIFIKMPFLFFLSSMKSNRHSFPLQDHLDFDQSAKDQLKQNEQDFQQRMKTLQEPKIQKTEKTEKKEEKREEKKKEVPKKPKPQDFSAENVFELRPNQTYTKEELKKKYHHLLKLNHPDKVASLGAEFKSLAEKKTKEINSAYNKLKSKAA